jgi:hypothetical protein
MDEKEKVTTKTYTFKELLEILKRGKEEIPPASGARDWLDNPTRFKLREAKHHLNIAHREYMIYLRTTTYDNRDNFLFSLSAFFSSIRSIKGNYMDKQYGKYPGFKEWYRQQNLGSDPEIVFLNQLRTEYVHIKPRLVATERELTCAMTTRIIYADGDPRKESASPLPEALPSEPPRVPQITTFDLIIPLDEEMIKLGLNKDLPVLDYCDRQYRKVEALVFRCEEQFPKSSV